MNINRAATFTLTLSSLAATPALAQSVTVTVENLQPTGGLFFTPLWVGFHDGSFDLFNPGGLATSGLERIAEDGTIGTPTTPGTIAFEFATSPAGLAGGVGGVIADPDGFAGAPVIDTGDIETVAFNLNDTTLNRFFTFATMVIPSNDAFLGNPNAIELFDPAGNFLGPRTFTILGSQVWDAGTEANDELQAAFINQTGPDLGTATSEAIALHQGFIGSVGNPAPGLNPIILGGTNAAGGFIDPILADFTRNGGNVELLRITIVPEPAAAATMLTGIALLARRRRQH